VTFPILHYDYQPERSESWRKLSALRFARHPDISYTCFQNDLSFDENQRFLFEEEGVYQALLEMNPRLFLAHPGVSGQRTVLIDIPRKFPQLGIGLMSASPDDYVGRRPKGGELSFGVNY
jgi:hypothetical protein